MQGDAHQSAFAAGLHVGNSEQRLGTKLAILVDAHAAYPFRKKHAPIRRPNNRPRHFQMVNHSLNPKTYAILRGSLSLFGIAGGCLHFARTAAWRRVSTGEHKQNKENG